MKKQFMSFHIRRPIRKKNLRRFTQFTLKISKKESRITIRTLCGVKRKLCSELFIQHNNSIRNSNRYCYYGTTVEKTVQLYNF